MNRIKTWFVDIWRAIWGSWYCEYCNKWHTRSMERIYMIITSRQIRTTDHIQAPQRCVCYTGVTMLKSGAWRPEKRDVLDEAVRGCTVAFSDLASAFNGKPTHIIDTLPRESPLDTAVWSKEDKWPWLSTYDSTRKSVDYNNWKPELWFACEPRLNTDCKKTSCAATTTLNCTRTSNPSCSIDGKVLWPDPMFDKVEACKHCPLDPAECACYRSYLLSLGKAAQRPCEVYPTYTDFRQQ